MDVKWQPGWEEDVRIKCVNIVDEASNLQNIYLFFATVSSMDTSLRKAPFAESCVSRTQLGETLQRALEADGSQLSDVAGEVHEQVGRI